MLARKVPKGDTYRGAYHWLNKSCRSFSIQDIAEKAVGL